MEQNIKPIRTEKEYEVALKKIEKLMEAKMDTADGDLLEVLSILIEEYERKHYPIDEPDPIEFIKFKMEQMGLKQKDMAEYFGGKEKVSEVLNRKRGLSIKMIKNLNYYVCLQ